MSIVVGDVVKIAPVSIMQLDEYFAFCGKKKNGSTARCNNDFLRAYCEEHSVGYVECVVEYHEDVRDLDAASYGLRFIRPVPVGSKIRGRSGWFSGVNIEVGMGWTPAFVVPKKQLADIVEW
jgi:hypothetical protein